MGKDKIVHLNPNRKKVKDIEKINPKESQNDKPQEGRVLTFKKKENQEIKMDLSEFYEQRTESLLKIFDFLVESKENLQGRYHSLRLMKYTIINDFDEIILADLGNRLEQDEIAKEQEIMEIWESLEYIYVTGLFVEGYQEELKDYQRSKILSDTILDTKLEDLYMVASDALLNILNPTDLIEVAEVKNSLPYKYIRFTPFDESQEIIDLQDQLIEGEIELDTVYDFSEVQKTEEIEIEIYKLEEHIKEGIQQKVDNFNRLLPETERIENKIEIDFIYTDGQKFHKKEEIDKDSTYFMIAVIKIGLLYPEVKIRVLKTYIDIQLLMSEIELYLLKFKN